MEKFDIPEKEKCPENGYTINYDKELIEEFCDNPSKYSSSMCRGAINDAIVLYKYSSWISRDWVEYVIDTLSPYID
jgi:hypothetical protein